MLMGLVLDVNIVTIGSLISTKGSNLIRLLGNSMCVATPVGSI